MKQYAVYVSDRDYAILEADDIDHLQRKLSTGAYGIFPIRGRDFISFTPQTVKRLVELEEKSPDKDNS